MQEPVADACLVDVSRLRIKDIEGMVAAMMIDAAGKVAVQRKNIIHQAHLELLYVPFAALASDKLCPSFQ